MKKEGEGERTHPLDYFQMMYTLRVYNRCREAVNSLITEPSNKGAIYHEKNADKRHHRQVYRRMPQPRQRRQR